MFNQYAPIVIEKSGNVERSYDIFSRLHKERIILLGTAIDGSVANVIVAQLLHLNSEDPTAAISLWVNSPGGQVTAGMAIVDTMAFISAPVYTTGFGLCASMGAVILTSGTKGHRSALPSAEIMIHQPWGGVQGTASDISIQAEQIIKTKRKLNQLLANQSGKTLEEVEKATDRDNYMSADEALKFGLIDKVIQHQEA